MPETVLVTICCNHHRGDFELPAQLPFENWEKALLDAVKTKFRILSGSNKIRLLKDQLQIQPQWTLLQCGIYDGSILHVIIE